MGLEGIVSIGGFGGLYKIISSTKNGVIVESLEDKKRMQAFAHFKISALSEISIYTLTDNAALSDILKKIYEKENKGKTSIEAKADSKELKIYFKEILPEYDDERVYVSDIKKIINWYNILHAHDMLVIETETNIEKQPDTDQKEEALEAKPIEAIEAAEPKTKKAGLKKKNSAKSEPTETEAN